MKCEAATLTLVATIDVDDMTPSLALNIEIDPAFSFLAGKRSILAGWLHSVAKDLESA